MNTDIHQNDTEHRDVEEYGFGLEEAPEEYQEYYEMERDVRGE